MVGNRNSCLCKQATFIVYVHVQNFKRDSAIYCDAAPKYFN